MPKYEMRHQQDDEDNEPRELVGSKDIRKSFDDKDRIRGSWFLNGVEFNQFEAISPASVVEQINTKSDRTGVSAEIDDKGHLVLVGPPGKDISLRLGRPYEDPAPRTTGDAAKDALEALKTEGEKQKNKDADKNTILDDLGLKATEGDEEAKNAAPRPGFETGASAEDRKKAREQAAQAGAAAGSSGTAGQGQTRDPTQVPSAPITGGAQQGKLDDGRGRTGDGTGYSPRPDGGDAVRGTPANPGPRGADPTDNSAPKANPPV
jgi:hypothetical protein